MIKDLICNSDIKNIEKKAKTRSISVDEANLLRQSKWSESNIQQACKNIFRARFKGQALFIQTDNARATKFQRMKAGREGYEKGMTDVVLVGKNKVVFVEFKRIGAPSSIDPQAEQKQIQKFLIECGFSAYYCNNTVFFEKIICEEFC